MKQISIEEHNVTSSTFHRDLTTVVESIALVSAIELQGVVVFPLRIQVSGSVRTGEGPQTAILHRGVIQGDPGTR
jgi:hypothetical protein